MVSYDDLTYIPGTTDLDFTSRYDVLKNDVKNSVLRSVFRTEQVDDRTTVTHDFGKDFKEDTEDDTFTVDKNRVKEICEFKKLAPRGL